MNLERRPRRKVKQGDTLVTLTCDKTLDLEPRVELLAYAFAKAVQGSILRSVEEWDITNGCIKFVLGHVSAKHVPRGLIELKLEDALRDHLTVVEENATG
jgi:hypothetical protein